MPRLTIGLGGILVLLGIVAYIATAFASATALIPSALGVILVISGIIGVKRPKIGIHIALVVALVGALGTLMQVSSLPALFAGEAERPGAVITGTIAFVLLVVYLVLGVRSFIRARRWEGQQG
ncbi:hypothetical protein [Nesterenkonia sp. F]|uniref:hypothetical protein n=1 Tax=Nesterenkonia sp. F TaxID=795955 RepID=UPI000255D026|nr:hypothetical protein [Nesterenkonia sp. F]